MRFPLTPMFAALILLSTGSLAFAGPEDDVAAKLKSNGYRCTLTPDALGYFCTGGRPTNYIVLPKGVDKYEKTVFYAHGLVGVCGNGASGEQYLKNQSKTLRTLKAVSIMPFRQSANNTGFQLASYVQKMDPLVGGARPLLLAGHSAAGPFFGTTLNGTGAGIVSRVEKILLLDAGYGDLRQRYENVMRKNPNIKLKIVATTTKANSTSLYKHIANKFGAGRVQLITGGTGHCAMPQPYFSQLAL